MKTARLCGVNSVLVAAVLVIEAATSAHGVRADENAGYTAYWLFNEHIDDGKEYGPYLLLSRFPLEELKKRAAELPAKPTLLLESDALLIQTYRKDSIWNANGQPIRMAGPVELVDKTNGQLRIGGRQFRFERAALKDAVRLLEHPTGKLPLHRKHGPVAGAEQTTRALVLLLKSQAVPSQPSR